MCGYAEAQLALAIVGAVGQHQQASAAAKAQEQSNKITQENANISYLNDLQSIEGERVDAAREFKRKQITKKHKFRKDMAQALNMNLGNPQKIVQELAGQADTDYIELANAFNADIRKANYQEKQAYGTYMQTLSKYTKPVEQPSVFATGLSIAGAGLSYGRDPNSLINIKPKDVDKVGQIQGSSVG